MMNALVDTSQIMDILSEIPDPEIPVISITEMGIVRKIEKEGNKIIVTITPTYSGCPAMDFFEKDIRKVLMINGFDEVEVKTIYHPAWTTDWMNESTKEKLRAYGIAPPVGRTTDNNELFQPPAQPACPLCGSEKTALKSQFGSTACKALYACNDCLEPFEYFKCI